MVSLATQLSSRRLARAEARQSHSELKVTLCNLIDKDERFVQHIRTALEEYQRKVAEEQAAGSDELADDVDSIPNDSLYDGSYDEFDAILRSVESGAVAPLKGSWLLLLYEAGGRINQAEARAP